MIRKLLHISFGVVIFLFFVFFSYLVQKQVFKQFDFDMTVKVQDHVGVVFDDIFSTFSLIGSFEIVTVFLLILLVFRSVSDKTSLFSIGNIFRQLLLGTTTLGLYGFFLSQQLCTTRQFLSIGAFWPGNFCVNPTFIYDLAFQKIGEIREVWVIRAFGFI